MEDLNNLPAEQILNCNSSVYRTKELWTYGFIIQLLEYCSRANVGAQMIRVQNQTFKVTKRNWKAVNAACSRMETDGKVLPFFILDEMTPSGEVTNAKKVAAFQRNVFRACGLVVVVMGTDAKISNLSVPFGDPAKANAWQKVIKLHPVVKHIAKHSRGLFSRYFVDAVVQFALEEVAGNETFELADLLDAAFETVSVKAQNAKEFMSTQEGRDAQLMALSYTSILPTWHGLKVRDVRDAWRPICRFPVIEKDVLLYLAVLGGKKFSAYYNNNKKQAYSTAGVFRNFRRRIGNRTHGNTNALSNDFSEFENMVAHALFCASRRNGVRGIAFNDFFSGLVGEFQYESFHTKPFDASALLEGYAGLKEKFAGTMIPFLAPPNARWPGYIIEACGDGDGDCKFGHLVRAQNSERLDCYVMVPGDANPLFVCECKPWNKTLDSGEMKKIIVGLNAESTGGEEKRKWHNWDLALVFCQKLMKFETEQTDDWDTGIVTVDCKTWVVDWIIESEAGEKLVIVLQTGGLL
ncbi:hypothetical protein V7S43_014326 [Phytophthora oleae]|uniref:Crinkler (CRN) family protein n=1 Tax=Phytophthora oleae TaxID=2107226 RepID=A0ABD3F2E0_9STRA